VALTEKPRAVAKLICASTSADPCPTSIRAPSKVIPSSRMRKGARSRPRSASTTVKAPGRASRHGPARDRKWLTCRSSRTAMSGGQTGPARWPPPSSRICTQEPFTSSRSSSSPNSTFSSLTSRSSGTSRRSSTWPVAESRPPSKGSESSSTAIRSPCQRQRPWPAPGAMVSPRRSRWKATVPPTSGAASGPFTVASTARSPFQGDASTPASATSPGRVPCAVAVRSNNGAQRSRTSPRRPRREAPTSASARASTRPDRSRATTPSTDGRTTRQVCSPAATETCQAAAATLRRRGAGPSLQPPSALRASTASPSTSTRPPPGSSSAAAPSASVRRATSSRSRASGGQRGGVAPGWGTASLRWGLVSETSARARRRPNPCTGERRAEAAAAVKTGASAGPRRSPSTTSESEKGSRVQASTAMGSPVAPEILEAARAQI
jgi:hypothetical protein